MLPKTLDEQVGQYVSAQTTRVVRRLVRGFEGKRTEARSPVTSGMTAKKGHIVYDATIASFYVRRGNTGAQPPAREKIIESKGGPTMLAQLAPEMPSAWKDALAEAESYTHLATDWDEEGSPPVDPVVFGRFKAFLELLAQAIDPRCLIVGVEGPLVSAGHQGNIQMDWDNERGGLVANFLPAPLDRIDLYLENKEAGEKVRLTAKKPETLASTLAPWLNLLLL